MSSILSASLRCTQTLVLLCVLGARFTTATTIVVASGSSDGPLHAGVVLINNNGLESQYQLDSNSTDLLNLKSEQDACVAVEAADDQEFGSYRLGDKICRCPLPMNCNWASCTNANNSVCGTGHCQSNFHQDQHDRTCRTPCQPVINCAQATVCPDAATKPVCRECRDDHYFFTNATSAECKRCQPEKIENCDLYAPCSALNASNRSCRQCSLNYYLVNKGTACTHCSGVADCPPSKIACTSNQDSYCIVELNWANRSIYLQDLLSTHMYDRVMSFLTLNHTGISTNQENVILYWQYRGIVERHLTMMLDSLKLFNPPELSLFIGYDHADSRFELTCFLVDLGHLTSARSLMPSLEEEIVRLELRVKEWSYSLQSLILENLRIDSLHLDLAVNANDTLSLIAEHFAHTNNTLIQITIPGTHITAWANQFQRYTDHIQELLASPGNQSLVQSASRLMNKLSNSNKTAYYNLCVAGGSWINANWTAINASLQLPLHYAENRHQEWLDVAASYRLIEEIYAVDAFHCMFPGGQADLGSMLALYERPLEQLLLPSELDCPYLRDPTKSVQLHRLIRTQPILQALESKIAASFNKRSQEFRSALAKEDLQTLLGRSVWVKNIEQHLFALRAVSELFPTKLTQLVTSDYAEALTAATEKIHDTLSDGDASAKAGLKSEWQVLNATIAKLTKAHFSNSQIALFDTLLEARDRVNKLLLRRSRDLQRVPDELQNYDFTGPKALSREAMYYIASSNDATATDSQKRVVQAFSDRLTASLNVNTIKERLMKPEEAVKIVHLMHFCQPYSSAQFPICSNIGSRIVTNVNDIFGNTLTQVGTCLRRSKPSPCSSSNLTELILPVLTLHEYLQESMPHTAVLSTFWNELKNFTRHLETNLVASPRFQIPVKVSLGPELVELLIQLHDFNVGIKIPAVKDFFDSVRKAYHLLLEGMHSQDLLKLSQDLVTADFVIGGNMVEVDPLFSTARLYELNLISSGLTYDDGLSMLQAHDVRSFNSTLTPEMISRLGTSYQRFNKTYHSVLEEYLFKAGFEPRHSVKRLVATTKDVIAAIKANVVKTTEEILDSTAMVAAAWTIVDIRKTIDLKHFTDLKFLRQPNVVQCLGLFISLDLHTDEPWIVSSKFNVSAVANQLIQISTGGGKSIQLGISATVLALYGWDVDVASYSTFLSHRDAKDFESLFSAFGVDQMISYGNMKELANKEVGWPSRECFLSVFNSSVSYNATKCQPQVSPRRVLLVDEVDNFFQDKLYANSFNPIITLQNDLTVRIFRSIWSRRNSTNAESLEKEILASADFQTLKGATPSFIHKELSKQVSNFVKKSVNAESLLPEHATSNGLVVNTQLQRIGYESVEGVSYNTSRGALTMIAQLSYFPDGEETDKMLGFELKTGRYSYSALLQRYNAIIGLSGTLQNLTDIERQVLRDRYHMNNIYIIPNVYGASKLRFLQQDHVLMETTTALSHQALTSRIRAQQTDKQAILVFWQSQAQMSAFLRSSYGQEFGNVAVVNDTTSEIDLNNYVMRSTTPGHVTFLTSRYGRGTDFVVYAPNTTVHVIQTFFSANASEQIQIMGRTSRQGKSGSYEMVLNMESLVHQFPSITASQLLAARAEQGVYRLLNQARLDNAEKKMAALKKQAESYEKQHNLSLKILQNYAKWTTSDIVGLERIQQDLMSLQ